MVDISKISEEKFIPFDNRHDFISIGNGKHAPNVDSVKVLKQHIWPLIRKQLPNAKIHIYGAYLPQQVNEMYDPKTGFYVEGWAEDLVTVLQSSRVLLAPLQFGAGIKGKLLDAMRMGTPSITTTIGAEGMHGDLAWNGYITNDWGNFAKVAVELYQNRNAWKHVQQQGMVLLQNFYDKEVLQSKLGQKLHELSQSLKIHREQNFIGQLLQHQTMASTKYMAKWIEEKQKNHL